MWSSPPVLSFSGVGVSVMLALGREWPRSPSSKFSESPCGVGITTSFMLVGFPSKA